MTTAEILQHFHARGTGPHWQAFCPVHEPGGHSNGHRPSLSISAGTAGRTLLKCFAGCPTESILAVAGLTWADINPTPANGSRQIADTYPYYDEAGHLLYEVVRWEPKAFSVRRPDGAGGWIWKLEDTRRVLYRLPALKAATEILIPEGEKDVEALVSRGFVATTYPGGAGKWRPDFTAQLQALAPQARIILLPDQDATGREGVQHIQAQLGALSVSVLDVPGAKDVSAWFAAGHTTEELRALLARLRPAPLVAFTLDELQAHVFPPRRALLKRHGAAVLSEGHIGQVCAPRGMGKTWLLESLALAAAAGIEVMSFSTPDPCRVLYVDGEMASLEIQERFNLLRERLHVPCETDLTILAADWQEDFLHRLDTTDGQAAIEPFIAAHDLIVLDNRSCLFDPESEKDPSAWQAAQEWLLSLRRRGKAVLLGHHANRQGGARGHSRPEDVMNLLITLSHPDDYRQDQGARFRVTFDKARGLYGDAVAPFLAHFTLTGWQWEAVTDSTEFKVREYLRLAGAARAWPKSANAAIKGAGVKKTSGLKIWAELLKGGTIVKFDKGYRLSDKALDESDRFPGSL